MGVQEAEPTGSGTIRREQAHDRGSTSPENPLPTVGREHHDPMETSIATHPTTIIFDLNAMSEAEPEEQGFVQDMCDLSLNLTDPTLPDMIHPSYPTALSPPQEAEEVLMRKEADHIGEEASFVGQSHVSCPAALMTGVVPTGNTQMREVLRTAQASQSHSAKLVKMRGDMGLDKGPEKRRKINMSQLIMRKGGTANPVATHKEARTNRGGRNEGNLEKQKPSQNTGSGGCPKKATGPR